MDGGGGGNEVKAGFISQGRAITQNPKFSSEDRKALATGLKAISSVEVVSVLRFADGTPVPNQNFLIAWTNIINTKAGHRAEIQLKQGSGHSRDGDSWVARVQAGESLEDEVFHEIMRASNRINPRTGKSIDENYELSRIKYKLDEDRKQDYENRVFTNLKILHDLGVKFCRSFAAGEKQTACLNLVQGESSLIFAALRYRKEDQMSREVEFWAQSMLFTGLLLKDDKQFGETAQEIQELKLREFNEVIQYKGIGLDLVHAALMDNLRQTSSMEDSPERAYLDFTMKFDELIRDVLRFKRIANFSPRG